MDPGENRYCGTSCVCGGDGCDTCVRSGPQSIGTGRKNCRRNRSDSGSKLFSGAVSALLRLPGTGGHRCGECIGFRCECGLLRIFICPEYCGCLSADGTCGKCAGYRQRSVVQAGGLDGPGQLHPVRRRRRGGSCGEMQDGVSGGGIR